MLYILNKILKRNGRSGTDLFEKKFKNAEKSLSSKYWFLPTIKQNTILLLCPPIQDDLTGLRKQLNLVTLPDTQFGYFVHWWYWYSRCNMRKDQAWEQGSRKALTTVCTWACKGTSFCSQGGEEGGAPVGWVHSTDMPSFSMVGKYLGGHRNLILYPWSHYRNCCPTLTKSLES